MGGLRPSIVRIWTGDVCVRSSSASRPVPPSFDEERVDRVPRRVVGREVQRFEVVPVGLDLGPVGDLVAEAAERRLDPAPHDRQRVEPPDGRDPRRERDVDGLRRFGERRRAAVAASASRASRRASTSCLRAFTPAPKAAFSSFGTSLRRARSAVTTPCFLPSQRTFSAATSARQEAAATARGGLRLGQLVGEEAAGLLDRVQDLRGRTSTASGAAAPQAAARALLADETSAVKPFGSWKAISARTLRFTSEPAFFSPATSCE